MATNVELYELLKGKLGAEAARVLAESVPATQELATKADIAVLKAEVAEFKADMRGWMLSFFVPLWLGVYGTLIALVVSLIVR